MGAASLGVGGYGRLTAGGGSAAPAERATSAKRAAPAADRGASKSGSAAAAGLVHRLSRTAVFLVDENRTEGTGQRTCERRYRLSLVRHSGAVPHGRQHHGIRSGSRERVGPERRPGRQALDIGHGGRRLLAQRPDQ